MSRTTVDNPDRFNGSELILAVVSTVKLTKACSVHGLLSTGMVWNHSGHDTIDLSSSISIQLGLGIVVTVRPMKHVSSVDHGSWSRSSMAAESMALGCWGLLRGMRLGFWALGV